VSVQFDIGQLIDTIRAGIGAVPAALIAMILLGGPTAGWLLYRFVVQPRTIRMRLRGVDRAAMWICANCRSVNALRLPRCYRCDALPLEGELEVIDTQPAGPVRLTPVGPGLDLGGPSPAMGRTRPISHIDRAPEIWAEQSDEWEGWNTEEELARDRAALPDLAAMTEVVEAPGRGRSVPVGPGRPAVARPAVARPRRAIVVGGSRDPDDSPAA
jgi:hypothetical protein